ncbi:MAG: hypothetical protein ACERKZ_20480 [Lachnotalea sp.]
MKKKLKWIIIFLLIVLCFYSFMTPRGALRFAIAISGHPIKSITSLDITDKSYFYTEDNQIGYSLDNPPYDTLTATELRNWVVTQYGVFYIAEYYGEG